MKVLSTIVGILRWMPKNEITWYCFFRDLTTYCLFFVAFYYAENITEFMSATFGDGNKYLPANENRKEFRMIIVSIISFIGVIQISVTFYKLLFKKPEK